MKRKLIFLITGVLMLGLVISCSDNKDGGGAEPFSQKSVEDNKEVVESSAIKMAQTMDDMKDLESVDAAVSLGNLLDMADPMNAKSKKKSKINYTIKAIAGLQSGNTSLHDVFYAMKAPGDLLEDPETLQDVWNELVGTYTWNSQMNDWDYSANSNQLMLKFPSTEGGMTNDATLTVHSFQSVIITTPLEGEYDGDVPTALKMDLTVGSTNLISFVFAASYNADGIPEMVAGDLTIQTFKFEVDLTNNKTLVAANYKLTNGSQVVMDVGGSVSGNFTQANIDANTTSEPYTYWDYQYNEMTGYYEYVEVTDYDEEVKVQNIAQSATAKWQLFDIALKGDVNIKGLVDATDAAWPDNAWEDENFDEKAATEKEAAAFNQHLNVRAVIVSTGEKIAQVEAYVVSDNYWEDYWDYWVDFRLTFGDGSKVDFETYFEQGFSDFVAEINSMITDLNQEYDWDLEAIDY